jgi:hypothetical protein
MAADIMAAAITEVVIAAIMAMDTGGAAGAADTDLVADQASAGRP